MQLVRVMCVFLLHQNGLVKTPAPVCMWARPRKFYQKLHGVSGMSVRDQNGLVKTPALVCMRARPRKFYQQLRRVSGMSALGLCKKTLGSILLHTQGRLQSPTKNVYTLLVVVAAALKRNVT